MDFTSPKVIKEILEKYQAKPLKGLGQNFLIDKNVLQKIIEASNLKPTDTVLEIGPGIGTLTQALAGKVDRVISVEKDSVMAKILNETLLNCKNVKVISGDILKTDVSSFKLQALKYKVIANIPYYITSPLIRKLLEEKNPPQEMVLMVQKEVAQRICSKSPDINLLAVPVQFYAEPKIISYVSKNCFWPSPKIDSAIIKITPKTLKEKVLPDLFFKIVKAGFSQPRKQLIGNLSKGLNEKKEKISQWLEKNNIDPKSRAETLYIEDWKNLATSYPLLDIL